MVPFVTDTGIEPASLGSNPNILAIGPIGFVDVSRIELDKSHDICFTDRPDSPTSAHFQKRHKKTLTDTGQGCCQQTINPMRYRETLQRGNRSLNPDSFGHTSPIDGNPKTK